MNNLKPASEADITSALLTLADAVKTGKIVIPNSDFPSKSKKEIESMFESILRAPKQSLSHKEEIAQSLAAQIDWSLKNQSLARKFLYNYNNYPGIDQRNASRQPCRVYSKANAYLSDADLYRSHKGDVDTDIRAQGCQIRSAHNGHRWLDSIPMKVPVRFTGHFDLTNPRWLGIMQYEDTKWEIQNNMISTENLVFSRMLRDAVLYTKLTTKKVPKLKPSCIGDTLSLLYSQGMSSYSALFSAEAWCRLIGDPDTWRDVLDTETRLDVINTGRVGTLMGMSLYSDVPFQLDLRFLVGGEYFLMAMPEILGGYQCSTALCTTVQETDDPLKFSIVFEGWFSFVIIRPDATVGGSVDVNGGIG